MAKAESLLRWHHPQLGLIGPADFIPLAEETGLIIEIGDWVFRQTASYAAGLQRATPLQLSINMSALQFQSDSNDLALSEAIVIMAHKLGLKVIAEGVETEAQRQLLLSIGCDYGQGYLFSRPLPASKFEQFIARTTQGNELW